MAEACAKEYRRSDSSVHATVATKGLSVTIAASGTTDIGSARATVNQDTYLVQDLGEGNLVLGVFDGHGKETGHVAAHAAKAFIAKHFSDPSALLRLEAAPEAELRALFRSCHAHLLHVFKAHYASQGACTKDEGHDGSAFLLKRKATTMPFTCVQGGTTATVAVLLRGTRLVVANVGDSTALLAGTATVSCVPLTATADAPAFCAHATGDANNDAPTYTLLSGDHSAESAAEFARVRRSHAPGLQFLFDTPTPGRCERLPIFTTAADGAVVRQTRDGRYYKNVRNEWASMVAAPAESPFADCLAFTRSLGDFHLQAHGLTWQPDVVAVDLAWDGEVALVLATDGVWDVWQYDELARFVLGAKEEPEGGAVDAKGRARRLMLENLSKAQCLFGDQADNMTAVVCFLSRA
ncbi:hypothetical protein ACHHYP_02925 [Achlya hypogyna]|uniref:PPM-type phosphatase domain-containing protein n=1 Tax=Achlya hypogyna TaxID=1202772 RepID=A0A1V9Z544_ACHHY|nr:hypothetical protein ACHHYP_02925 [Achlya hypogyna]